MISGSYTGGISFFKGLGDGKFAAARKLLNAQGKPISEEYAQTPCLADWNGNGRYDMAIGAIQGPVKLYRNDGSLVFTEVGPFTVKGKPIEAADGGPCLVDWDGDGILDMVLGDDEGNVIFYRGTAKGSLEMEFGGHLIPPRERESLWKAREPDPGHPIPFKPKHPGARVKPFAVDWNGNGKLDLLVGDYMMIQPEAKTLTAAEQRELAELEVKSRELSQRMQAISQKILERIQQELGITDLRGIGQEKMRELSQKYSDELGANKEYQALMPQGETVESRISELRAQPRSTGVVWVYLRK
jgi:hypothetical protein